MGGGGHYETAMQTMEGVEFVSLGDERVVVRDALDHRLQTPVSRAAAVPAQSFELVLEGVQLHIGMQVPVT